MSNKMPDLPSSVRERFSVQRELMDTKFEESSSFREICLDYAEVVDRLTRLEPNIALAAELRGLAAELEAELLSELASAGGG